jgi:hypothetical protein
MRLNFIQLLSRKNHYTKLKYYLFGGSRRLAKDFIARLLLMNLIWCCKGLKCPNRYLYVLKQSRVFGSSQILFRFIVQRSKVGHQVLKYTIPRNFMLVCFITLFIQLNWRNSLWKSSIFCHLRSIHTVECFILPERTFLASIRLKY